jgi:hypothetical protein
MYAKIWREELRYVIIDLSNKVLASRLTEPLLNSVVSIEGDGMKERFLPSL